MTAEVVVVGGGVIGLAVAWRSALAGLPTTVLDDRPATGASHAAAGMLCPVTEAHYGEEALLALNLASAERWPAFAAELEAAAGLAPGAAGYRTEGTLAVAFDEDDLRALEELHLYHLDLGLDTERLTSRACRALEPRLTPRVRGGILVPTDRQVETRAVTAALLRAGERAGVRLVRRRATELVADGGRATGVRADDGTVLGASTAVVLAAGAWSGALAPLPVRPVKGEILRLQGAGGEPVLTHNLRGVRHGRSVYVVPRRDGRVIVGATVEEKGFDTTVTAGAVRALLDDAVELVPALADLDFVEAVAGLRPGTPDNAPLIGASSLDGLVVAAGHFRNGFLLTPVTADAVCELLTTGVAPEVIRPFSPQRFEGGSRWS
ncbi:MAG: glycine oxidase ThiO [Acidimicrobiales bacterium]